MVKAVLVFLAVILILGMIGKWRLPSLPRKRGTAVTSARKCPTCGVYAVRDAAKPCGRADCPLR